MNDKCSPISKMLLTLAAAVMLCVAPAVAAQDRIAVNLTDPTRPVNVRASLLNGGITVRTGDSKEVIVEARVRDEERSGRSRGSMKRIPMTSTGLSVEEENNQVRIGTDSVQRTIDLIITVPRQTSLKLNTTNDGDIRVTGVEGEIDVNSTNGEVHLTGVSGSVVAHALNGEIKVTMMRVDPKPMAFSSLNGDIDVTFPADLKANISVRSDNGEVLSDFDIQLQAASSQPIVEDSRGKGGKYKVKLDKTVRGSINGGGPEIQFKNFNGDILIRKAGAPR